MSARGAAAVGAGRDSTAAGRVTAEAFDLACSVSGSFDCARGDAGATTFAASRALPADRCGAACFALAVVPVTGVVAFVVLAAALPAFDAMVFGAATFFTVVLRGGAFTAFAVAGFLVFAFANARSCLKRAF